MTERADVLSRPRFARLEGRARVPMGEPGPTDQQGGHR